jgi:hypothetical protein
MSDEVQTSVHLTISKSELEYAKQVAAEHDVEVQELLVVQGVLPVIGIALIISGGVAAVAAVEHLINVHRGGQVIDLRRGNEHPFYRSHDLQYGLVLIYKDDGTIEVQVKDVPDAFSKVIDALKSIITDLGKATIDKAKAAVDAAVGDKGEVVVKPAVTPAPDSGA